MCREVMRLPTISPVANTSPVVSTAVTAITMSMETIPVRGKAGTPKKKGVVTLTASAWDTWEKSVSPSAQATVVAATRPTRTEMVPMNPLKTLWTRTIVAMVPRAYRRPLMVNQATSDLLEPWGA